MKKRASPNQFMVALQSVDTPEGYREAKKIHVEIHRALTKDLESLPIISNVEKDKEIHLYFIRTFQSCTGLGNHGKT